MDKSFVHTYLNPSFIIHDRSIHGQNLRNMNDIVHVRMQKCDDF